MIWKGLGLRGQFWKKKKNHRRNFFIFVIFLIGHAVNSWAGTVELHAHVFMDEGLGWFFRGDFEDPVAAKNWKQRFSSQISPQTLDQSGIDILVVSLYAQPIFVGSRREAIWRQIEQAREFVRENPDWVLALDPEEARQAIERGQRVMVLSLEGAGGVLENQSDLAEFIDRGGVRIVTLLHLADDRYGGAALMSGFRALANPFGRAAQLVKSSQDSQGHPVNPKGLTLSGKELAKELINRGVWIDLTHASDAAWNDLTPLIKESGQPFLCTHTVLRESRGMERHLSLEQLEEVAQSRGIIGLLPSEEYLDEGIFDLTRQHMRASSLLGSDSVMMGTDFNGGMQHLKPRCCTQTAFDREGFWNIGQVPNLWQSMKNLGASLPESPRAMPMRFIEAWKQAYAAQSLDQRMR